MVAELVGREKPDEVVVLGGHIDSWDVGQGAMDDAGGSVAAWEAVRLMQRSASGRGARSGWCSGPTRRTASRAARPTATGTARELAAT